jgi:AAA+ ATPase superfamily predicted ATPase
MLCKRPSKTKFLLLIEFKVNLTKEQRVCVKFCFKLGKTAMETLQLLQTAYREYSLSQTTVF